MAVRHRLATVVDAVASRSRSRTSVPVDTADVPANFSRSDVVDQLVVGHALLVQARALLMELRLRTLGLGFALRDPRALLGLGGLALARLGLGTMLAGHALAALLELTFALLDPGSRRMRGSMKARTAMMISATTTIAIMAPVVIGNLLDGVACKGSRHAAG